MARIFISYRREDSSAAAGRLHDRLQDHYGRDNVFMDVDNIEPGLDFIEVIERTVASCDVLIALIGRQWLTITDADGQRRLDNPEDFVRYEIATALKRNIRVIPALIQGALMPRAPQLPEDLQPLTRRNALELSDAHFHRDVDGLIEALHRVLGLAPSLPSQAGTSSSAMPHTGSASTAAPEPSPFARLVRSSYLRSSGFRWVVVAIGLFISAIIVGNAGSDETVVFIARTLFVLSILLLVIGIVLLVWRTPAGRKG
jgi:hypothetical protein